MQESLRLEESLREQLLHRGKRVPDQGGFDGLFKAFDLYDEPRVPMASRETQTDNSNTNMLGLPT